MSAIGKITEEIINRSPFIREAMTTNLINISAFARKIRNEVVEKLGQDVNEGAIIMAIKRLDIPKNHPFPNIKNSIENVDDFIVRNNLINYTFQNSEKKTINEIISVLETETETLYTYSKGIASNSITFSQLLNDKIKSLIPEHELNTLVTCNLASITLKAIFDPKESFGLHYIISKQLTLEGVYIHTLITGNNEFTLLVNQEQLDKAFQILLQLKKGA